MVAGGDDSRADEHQRGDASVSDGSGGMWCASGGDGRRRHPGTHRGWRHRFPDSARRRWQVRCGARAAPSRSGFGGAARRGGPAAGGGAFFAHAPGGWLARTVGRAGRRGGKTVNIPVIDTSGVAADPAMPSLALALDPSEVQRQFGRRLSRLAGQHGCVHLRTIRVTRYKPGRRCVIEYEVDVERPDAPPETLLLIGKVRVRRYGKSGYRLLDAFWNAGFQSEDRKSTRLNSSHTVISYAVFCLKKKNR